MARASGTDLAKRSRLGTTHDQGVALAHSGEGLIEAGPGAGGAGEAVVGVDAILGDAEVQEGLALGVQILAVGGTAGVSDEGCGHGGSVRIGSHNRNCYRTIHMRRSWLRFGGGVGDGPRCTLDDPLTDSPAPAEMKHPERAAWFDLSSEGQHYRRPGSTCSPPSSFTGIPPIWTKRLDSRNTPA